MTRPYRFLSSIANSSSSFDQTVAQPPEAVAVESDFVVILAALLCALICVLGLIAVARCAWLRRGSSTAEDRRNPGQTTANKGIKKKIVEALPKFVYDLSKEEGSDGGNCEKLSSSECAICLAEYTDGDEIRILPPCGHGFHVGCIDMWLSSHSSCPSCRQMLVMTRCRKCGEFPTVSSGQISTEVEHKGGQHDSSSCSSDYLP
ncbi:RING-H2 finger protein ATL8-like [Cynara cardunculus var. scolymus]|uniref:RING-H2 finger protein ATL8-like n=1 Tax=Cynara cardunculus var. scolymus TaxID=59895 RepID=UPI000D62FACA|nr:RING-H2 finger protein ATL8-like [Cynara cardunculus var. scolymus]